MRSSTAPSEAWARWGREEEDIPLTEEWTKATQIFTEDKKDMLLFMVRLLDCFRALSVGEIDDVGDPPRLHVRVSGAQAGAWE